MEEKGVKSEVIFNEFMTLVMDCVNAKVPQSMQLQLNNNDLVVIQCVMIPANILDRGLN